MRNLWHIDDSSRITPDLFLCCVQICCLVSILLLFVDNLLTAI